MSTVIAAEQLALFDIGVDVSRLREKCEVLMGAQKSFNTKRNYEHGWLVFSRWCASAGRQALPADPETLLLFIASEVERGMHVKTIRVRASAVADRHVQAGFPSPYVDRVRALICNAARSLRRPSRPKLPLTADHVRRVGSLSGLSLTYEVRDRAIVLFGFPLGWRASEIASLQLSDVRLEKDRVTVRLGASKADQDASRGRVAVVPAVPGRNVCPVGALRDWLEVRGRWAGPLFSHCSSDGRAVLRDPISVHVVRSAVKRLLERVGEDDLRRYGAHSLRAGMATVSAEHGADAISIMQRGGWRSMDTVLGYIRPAQAFARDPLRGAL